MSEFNTYLVSVARYILPILALFILARCVISLFRNRPRLHKMAQLVNESTGDIIDIDRWETSIGKSKSNDIVFNQPHIARFHAVVAKKRNDWVITDTSQREFGVLVNNKKIDSSAVIEDGDTISIGDAKLKFLCAEAVSAKRKKEIRTAATQLKQQNGNIAYAVLVDVKTHRPVYLRKKDVLIGRNDSVDIQIKLDTVSGEHARIHQTSRGWALSDLNSHNGTKLNGRFINEPQLIFDGDTVTFGNRVFVFYEK